MKQLLTNIICNVCNRTFTRKCDLSRHLTAKHGITAKEYTISEILKNNIPKCKCGCGNDVKVGNYCVNEYSVGHTGGGVFWQHKYDKNSIEYINISNKISKSVSKSMTGVKKSKEHCNNISIGRHRWIKSNPNKFKKSVTKMIATKHKQSGDGTLSKQHYTNTHSKDEIREIYHRIVRSSKETKTQLKSKGLYPEVWNKGVTSDTDDRIISSEKHYRYNPDKLVEYDELFFNLEYRAIILGYQNNKCFKCGSNDDLCLHHIDENKKNSDFSNLIFLCRSCHCKIHNSFIFKDTMSKEIKNFKSNMNIRMNDILEEINYIEEN